MYTSFYGLNEPPFNITPDSRFLFLSQRHKEALASLLYGIEHRKGFIVITGEIGSGKTTLCRALLKELDSEQIKVALIFNPLLTEVELLRAINQELEIEHQYNSKKDLIDELNNFLLAEISKGHNVVVVIDEAQNLTPPLLEQLRLLSNLETETEKLLQIVLVGQPELQATLELPQLRQLNQRIAVRYHLEPLSKEEVWQYIQHRLNVAGAKIDINFTPKALDLINEYTQGVPRNINILCDRALLIGFVEGTYEIDEKIIEKSIEEVSGKALKALSGSKSLGILPEPERAEKSRREKSRREKFPAGLIFATVGAVGLVVIMLVGALYWMDWQMGKRMMTYAKMNPATDVSEKKEDVLSVSQENESESPAITQPREVASIDNEEESGPEPSATPAPVRKSPVKKTYNYNWEYDTQGIIRVASPLVSYQASVLNWLTLWGYKPDLSGFRQLSTSQIMSTDITGEHTPLGLRKIEIPLPFAELIRLDVPVILNLNAAECDLSPWVVLRRVEGYSVTLIDPVKGLVVTSRKKIEPAYLGAIGLYFDKENLMSLIPDETGDRVIKLQEFLIQSGFLKGRPSGTFDSQTISAIKKLQKYYDLPATGELDPITLMLITTRQQPHRPRLYSSEE